MAAAPLIVGLYRGNAVVEADQPWWLREQWRENLGNGYNFTLIPLLKSLDGLATDTLDVHTYDALPQPAFTRKAHQALSIDEWRSIGGVLNGLTRPGLSMALVEHMANEAAQWAKYLGMHSVMIELDAIPAGDDLLVGRYAGILARLLQKSQYEGFHIWVKTNLDEQGWHQWNLLRNTISYMPKDRLHVLPTFTTADEGAVWNATYQRWFGENIQALILPTKVFQAGTAGQPVLSPALQKICNAFLPYHSLKWLVSGPCLHQGGYGAYFAPIAAVHDAYRPSQLEAFLYYSSDELLRPMQPLQDQLHSSNYEFFEQDPVKYLQYERAIAAALRERHPDGGEVVLMVLGAGRGPLVDAALRAAEGWPGKLRLFAVEKNPTAQVTLRHRANDDWHRHNVIVVSGDMRDWRSALRADIIVSELLGSWGDNELSPECLDGASHLLKEGGISIPQTYTSWLAPVSSAKLHNKVAACVQFPHLELDARRYFESMFVVKRSMMFPLAEEQACFTFAHPNTGMTTNARFTERRFQLTPRLQQCVVHGFYGTFCARLYGDIYISIAKDHYSEGMFCWFPLFIPLAVPLTLAGGSTLDLQVWRRVSANRVWYEWQVPGLSAIHNPGGRSSSLGLH